MKRHKFEIKRNRYGVDYDILVDGEVTLREVEKEMAKEMVKGAKEKLNEQSPGK